jgi:hypothetical protein
LQLVFQHAAGTRVQTYRNAKFAFVRRRNLLDGRPYAAGTVNMKFVSVINFVEKAS